MNKLKKYKKTIAATAIGGLTWATMVVESEPASITSTEYIAGGGIMLVALGVYAWKNETTSA